MQQKHKGGERRAARGLGGRIGKHAAFTECWIVRWDMYDGVLVLQVAYNRDRVLAWLADLKIYPWPPGGLWNVDVKVNKRPAGQ